jgi:hypothetical protein
MSDLEDSVQVAVRRAGESYLDTYQLDPDTVQPATRVAASFGVTLQELFPADREWISPGQEDLLAIDGVI